MLPTIATGIDNIFITGDTHFDHGNIIKFCHRPFLSQRDKKALEEMGGKWHSGSWKGGKSDQHKIDQDSISMMNQALIDNINKTVPKDGILIHLGDFALWPKSSDKNLSYTQRCSALRSMINCEKMYMLWGNHDRPDLLKYLFTWDGYTAKVQVNDDLQVVLFHYCQAVWDCSHRGAIHCYGHSHSDIEGGMETIMPGRRSMDVGVDNAAKILGEYRPFSLKEIVDRLGNKPGNSINPDIPTSHNGPRE